MTMTRCKLMALCWCLHLWAVSAESARPLRATATIVPVSTAPSQTAAPGKVDWWTEDHPYMYKFRYKRLANGSLVLNQEDDGEKVTLKKIREAAAANRSAAFGFVAARENRKTLRSVYQFMLMNLVPPMAHGSVMKQARIKKLQSKMLRNYFVRSVAIPGVKLIGSLIIDAIKLHYGSYIERKVLFKRMETMSLEEICAELNVTPPVYDAEAYFEAHRSNHTLPYEPRGHIHAFREYAVKFEPYTNYSLIYYSVDEDLPAPVLPAASYPWRWRRQLAETRDLVLQVMALTAGVQEQETAQFLEDDEVDDESEHSSIPSGPARTSAVAGDLKRRGVDGHGGISTLKPSVNTNMGSAEDDDEEDDDDKEVDAEFGAAQELENILAEYHFSTGIPRIVQQNSSYTPFPTLESLLNESAPAPAHNAASSRGGNISHSNSSGGRDAASSNHVLRSLGASPPLLRSPSSASNISDPRSLGPHEVQDREAELRRRKAILYDAMVQFYAYPCVDSSMVRIPRNGSRFELQPAGVNCSLAAPCLVQSGVTVYTPQLSTVNFFEDVVRNHSTVSTKGQQRRTRVQVLQSMAQVAFEADQKALEAGVQAPSTVWYSLFDYNVDQFADALQGQVRATWHSKPDGTNSSALEVYTTLVADKQRSLFHSVSSYYWSTLRDTKRAMLITKSVPMLEALTEAEQVALLTLIAAKMRDLDAAIAAFVEKRATDEEYRQVVNATVSRAEYEGSQYSTLGFGFLLPATNKKNVLYRDLRLPEPFHLALRLLVRVQESRLLLPDESFHIVACLAMLRSEISYYRCRPASA